MARILIVGNEAELVGLLAENLEVEGHTPRVASDAETALELAGSWEPELVILDLIRTDGSGEEVPRALRGSGYVGPILILTAKGDDGTRVRELHQGAADHLTKPFGLPELLARVENLLGRVPRRYMPEVVRLGEDVEIHPRGRRLLVEGREVKLRPMEMDLLLALLARRNQAVPRPVLLAEVWGYSPRAETRTVDWHVATLRSKLGENAQSPTYLKTVRAVGYRLDVADEDWGGA